MEITVIALAIGLTIILGWMVWIVTNDNIRRNKVLKSLRKGQTVFVMMYGEPKRVLILRNLVDRKVMVCRYNSMPKEFHYEEIIIELN